MADPTLLLVQTAHHKYAIRNDDVYAIRAVNTKIAPTAQERYIELGPLFDPADISDTSRRHAMLVPLRRKLLLFLVDRIDQFEAQPTVSALPKLIADHLHQPLAIGVVPLDDHMIVLLDLRAIARSVLSSPTLG